MQGFCTRCGDCCENIYIDYTPAEVQEKIKEYWASLDYYDDIAEADRERVEGNITSMLFVLENWIPKPNGRYECSMFNAETRLCEAGDDRPPICQGYPWYGGKPRSDKLDGKRCGYWYDRPASERPSSVLPIVEVR